MAAYRVLRPFLLGGRRRAPDTEIELTPRQARYLRLDGRIERIVPPASPDAGANSAAPPAGDAVEPKSAETEEPAPRRRGKKTA